MEESPSPQQPQPQPPMRALAALERDIAALREAWAGSMPAWGAVGGAAQVEV